MRGFVVSIPTPPSANGLFIWRQRRDGSYSRTKAPAYRRWLDFAGEKLLTQRRNAKRVSGPYRLLLTLPAIRGDADNRMKAASDLIVSMGLVDDDRYCVEFRVIVDREQPKGIAQVKVETA